LFSKVRAVTDLSLHYFRWFWRLRAAIVISKLYLLCSRDSEPLLISHCFIVGGSGEYCSFWSLTALFSGVWKVKAFIHIFNLGITTRECSERVHENAIQETVLSAPVFEYFKSKHTLQLHCFVLSKFKPEKEICIKIIKYIFYNGRLI
jgi:hypothetical protein